MSPTPHAGTFPISEAAVNGTESYFLTPVELGETSPENLKKFRASTQMLTGDVYYAKKLLFMEQLQRVLIWLAQEEQELQNHEVKRRVAGEDITVHPFAGFKHQLTLEQVWELIDSTWAGEPLPRGPLLPGFRQAPQPVFAFRDDHFGDLTYSKQYPHETQRRLIYTRKTTTFRRRRRGRG